MKIVISTNINYEKPIAKLFRQISRSGYDKINSEIIVVISGYKENLPPRRRKLDDFFPSVYNINCTVICTTFNSWEYTAYHMLYIHSNHPLVISDRYLLIMDTCELLPTFNDKMNKIRAMKFPEEHKAWIYSVKGLRVSNIHLFSKEVVDNYQNNFGRAVSKSEGIVVESEHCCLPAEYHKHKVCNIRFFGQVFYDKIERKKIGKPEKIYGTGRRTCFAYECFGIKKWILLWKEGDMTNNITDIEIPKHDLTCKRLEQSEKHKLINSIANETIKIIIANKKTKQ